MVDLGQTIGLTLLGIAYLLHMRWWHKPEPKRPIDQFFEDDAGEQIDGPGGAP